MNIWQSILTQWNFSMKQGSERTEEAIFEAIMAENLIKLTEDTMQLSVNMVDWIFQRACLPACCMAGIWEFSF